MVGRSWMQHVAPDACVHLLGPTDPFFDRFRNYSLGLQVIFSRFCPIDSYLILFVLLS